MTFTSKCITIILTTREKVRTGRGEKVKKRRLNTKNIIILYNIITILKYYILKQDILYYDFKIDFIFLNIVLYLIIKIVND